MEDITAISLKAFKEIAEGLSKFGITLTPEQEDEIYVPILERLDIIFISSWIYVFFKVITTYFYAATIEIQQIWCIKNRNNICFFIAPIVFLIAFFSGNIKQIERLTYWVASLTVFISLIIPIILLVLSILLKKGKVK